MSERALTIEPDRFALSAWAERLRRDPDAVEQIAHRVAAGEEMWNIARFYGVKRGQLMLWLTGDPGRALAYGAALSAASHDMICEGRQKASQADALLNRATRVIAEAGTGEDIDSDAVYAARAESDVCVKAAAGKLGLAKFHVELAGVVNPKDYGRKSQVTSVNVDVAVGDLLAVRARGVLDAIAGECVTVPQEGA